MRHPLLLCLDAASDLKFFNLYSEYASGKLGNLNPEITGFAP
jgi:hypothetical protein